MTRPLTLCSNLLVLTSDKFLLPARYHIVMPLCCVVASPRKFESVLRILASPSVSCILHVSLKFADMNGRNWGPVVLPCCPLEVHHQHQGHRSALLPTGRLWAARGPAEQQFSRVWSKLFASPFSNETGGQAWVLRNSTFHSNTRVCVSLSRPRPVSGSQLSILKETVGDIQSHFELRALQLQGGTTS